MPTLPHSSSRPVHLIALTTVLVITLVALVYGTNGIRGTDQYWYLADVETLAAQKAPLTNIVYPGKILREYQSTTTPSYFMHNGPLLHVVAAISKSSDPYSVWIVLNTLSHLLVALSIFLICRVYTSEHISIWLTILYLLSPIAIWQSVNMLQEQIYAGLFALSILWLAFPRVLWLQLVSTVFVIIGICSHPIFLILGIFNAVAWCIQGLSRRKHHEVAIGLCLGMLYAAAKFYSEHFFPSSFQPNLAAIISGSIPGKSNMMWHYTDTQVEVNIALLWDKFTYAINEHFFKPRNIPLFIYTNIALLLLPITFILGIKKYPWTLIFTLALGLGSYVAILVLMQTQARYQQIVAVITFVTIALAINEISNRYPSQKMKHISNICAMIFAVLTAALSVYMAHTAHKQSIAEAAAMKMLGEEISEIPGDARVLILDSSDHELKFSYALKPRRVLAARTDFIDEFSLSKAINTFDPTHVISKKTINLESVVAGNIKKIEDPYLRTFYIGKVN